ncbi:YcnI family copper-binding membrane protein [Mangrovihabitans endophyticus]|uniref:YncI copper-binding domain-containing protein n=1 Tax=Mangrovihabitans endophyticus TaxID=1751298 RepID=A0A8J3C5A0_9ACTN|nr:YcnI family protein [Mangrovihabitans endophyticus]GGL17021.1 hypothetical protein GCM10012284_59520 [Mangrovihabitans endophyticus]
MTGIPRRLATMAGATAAATLTSVLALAAPASAHVTVGSAAAVRGGYATVTFKVPSESDTAATTKLQVYLPTDTPFASVSLRPLPGWTATTAKTKLDKPITAHGTQITEAVSTVTWTASGDAAIKPGEFQTFDLSLGPMPDAGQVVFKALQTYSDGTVVRWIEEPSSDGTEPENPAPVLKLAPAAPGASAGDDDDDAVAAAPAEQAAADTDTGGDGGTAGTVLGVIALIVALGAAGLGALAYRRAAPPPAKG